MNVVARVLEPPTTKRQLTLLDNQAECVRLLMTPELRATPLKQERINSCTCLLAMMFAFKVLNRFGSSMTQRRMQEVYDVRPRQLAACVTGKCSARNGKHWTLMKGLQHQSLPQIKKCINTTIKLVDGGG